MDEYNDTLRKQRDYCIKRIESIDGIDVSKPMGSFFMFIRITYNKWKLNDKDFVLGLLQEEHVLAVHGSGFSQKYGNGHIRIVFLPSIKVLNEAFDRIERFLTMG